MSRSRKLRGERTAARERRRKQGYLLEDGFPAATLDELRHLLGPKFDDALPWLELAGALYEIALPLGVPANVRKEINELRHLLAKTDKAVRELSPDAVTLLSHPNNPTVKEPRVHIHHSLQQIARACESTQDAVGMAAECTVDSPGMVLATAVASALAGSGMLLSKGRDGVFAEVLGVVWHAADPENAPEDTFRYLRSAVDVVVADGRGVRATKGRPKQHKLESRNR